MHIRRVFVLGLVGATGIASAIALANPPPAKAWNVGSPPPGFTITQTAGCNGPDYTIHGGTWGSQDLGSQDPNCNNGSYTAFQTRLDYYIDSNCPSVQECYTAYPQYAPPPPPTTEQTTTTTDTTTTPADQSVGTTTDTTPACDVQCQIGGLQTQLDELRTQLAQLVQILTTWPGIDPGILAQLMSLA